jgi:exodeoxyribonuclease-3
LPTPPGPLSVTRRVLFNASLILASSPVRPTKEVNGTGRLCSGGLARSAIREDAFAIGGPMITCVFPDIGWILRNGAAGAPLGRVPHGDARSVHSPGVVPLRPVACDHLHDTTTHYDHDLKLLHFLLVCRVCGTEKLIETSGFRPAAEHKACLPRIGVRPVGRLSVGGFVDLALPLGERQGLAVPVPWESVRLATWNVNSVKQRVPRLLPWLDERRPDVVCLQETKLVDAEFVELLGDELAEREYAVAVHGEATWNGVAILSRVGLDDVVVDLPGAPGFPRPEARAVSATCGGIRVVSVYVPNGRLPGSEHYQYKLDWLASLREMVAAGPDATVVCGDMNIAPTDDDVFDPDAYIGQTHVTQPERAALEELQSLGLRDVVRDRWPNERVFTYWDYRAGMFHQDLGMRIDLVLASAAVAGRVQAAWVDRQARKGKGPSDHAPVIVDLDEAPDGNIGPVVPPPSAPVIKRGAAKLPQSAP